MSVEHLLLLVAAQMVALASPGPAVLRLMQTSFTQNRSAALRFGLGLGTAAALWACAAFLGMDALFAAVPWLFTVLKIAGGVYLIYIAWKIWSGAAAPIAMTSSPKATKDHFWSGLLTNFSNPKAALFFSAVFLTILPKETTLGEKSLVVGCVLGVELVYYTFLAFVFDNKRAQAAYLRAKMIIDRCCGALLAALGLSIIASRP